MPFGREDHIAEADLSAYLDAQLSGAHRTRCEAHLRDCTPCAQTLDGLRAVRASLRTLPRATAPRSFRVRETQEQFLHSRQPAFIVRIMPQLAGLSVVSLVAFFTLVAVNTTGGLGSDSGDGASSLMSAPARESMTAQDSFGPAPAEGSGATGLPVPETSAEGPPRSPAASFDSLGTPDGVTSESRDFGAVAEPTGVAGNGDDQVDARTRVGSSGDDSDTAIYIAMAVTAGLALASGGLAFAAYRRTR